MSLSFDVSTVYSFILHTPEAGLRKMLVDQKPMTDAHFNLMMKVIRCCNEQQFAEYMEKNEYPKIKFNDKETVIREKFWKDCIQTFQSRGLLQPAGKPKAA